MIKTVNIHASCVVLGDAGKSFGAPTDAGVLILGESGSGKSDLVLRLIERGAQLVADDRTELFAQDGALMGRGPASLAGLMEARGVGIVVLPFAAQVRISLVVTVVETQLPRLPQHEFYRIPPDLALPDSAMPPLIRLSAREASATAKICLAVAAFTKGLFREHRNP